MSGEPQVLQRPAAMRFRTKQEFVYKTLRDAIMRCELVPRQRLVIEDLARELQVSASPVREALQLLQSEGLVSNVPHTGATVSPIARESITEVFELMEGLEIVATRTTAQRMTAKDTAGFDEILTAMDDALRAGRYEQAGLAKVQLGVLVHLGVDVPMDHQELAAPVVVHVEKVNAPPHVVHGAAEAGPEHAVLERPVSAVCGRGSDCRR